MLLIFHNSDSMRQGYGKWLGLIAGAILFRGHPLIGALIGWFVGHWIETQWSAAQRSTTPYRILGVARTADDAEIEHAYRRLIARHHPDRFAKAESKQRAQATAQASKINAAYRHIRQQRQRSSKG